MSCIQATASQCPAFHYTAEEILAGAASWLKTEPRAYDLFERCIGASKISTRNFVIPLPEVLGLDGMAKRAGIFQREALQLACASARKALAAAAMEPSQIDALYFTSCSVPAIPSLDVYVMQQLELRHDIARVPMFQHGCGGGAVGLALASEAAASGKNALVVSVELCSLIYQKDDFQSGNLLGSVLFGDGSAAALICPQGTGPVFLDTRSLLIPGSAHLMGYDIRDDGLHLRLERELPSALAGFIPAEVARFLLRSGLWTSDIKWWLIHPGGMKILQLLEQSLDLEPWQTEWSWRVLSEQGNISSASILYVLEGFLNDRCYQPGDRVLMIGIGPGLSVQLNLLQV